MHIIWYQYLQLFCLLTALFYRKGLQAYSIELFIPLLVLINAVEIIGNNYQTWGWKDNYFFYNYYVILSAPLWLLLYKRMLPLTLRTEVVFNSISVLTMILLLLNYFFFQGRQHFNTYSLVLMMLLMIVFSCIVLFTITIQDNVKATLFDYPYFWINASNLLFSMVTLVLLGLQPFILANKLQIGYRTLYHAFMPPANILLYIGFSYAFYLCQRQVNRSLSL